MTKEDKIGYNYIEVGDLFNDIDDLVNETKRRITTCLNERIIDPMSRIWCAPEAIEFFKNFRRKVYEKDLEIDDAFELFVNRIDSAQRIWAKKTRSTMIAKYEKSKWNKITLDLDKIVEQRDGMVYLDPKAAEVFIERLNNIRDKLIIEIDNEKKLMPKLYKAFIGEEQKEWLNEYYESVFITIKEIFDFLIVGDNSLRAGINNAIIEYKLFTQKILDELK